MQFPPFAQNLPLRTDESGTVRVGSTRVTLESVVFAFKNGSTCEEICFQFPVLQLADVYSVVGFYLANQSAIDLFFEKQEAVAAQIRRKVQTNFPVSAVRERLQKGRTALKTA